MKRISCLSAALTLLIVVGTSGPTAVAGILEESEKVGKNALAHLRQAQAGHRAVIDITFSAQPYGTPFHRAGLDDDPRELEWVRTSILESAGVDERDIMFDASDIGVMSMMIDTA